MANLYLPFKNDEFDVITDHPPAIPYLPDADWGMSAGMNIATNGGPDGSDVVVRSIVEAHRCLKSGGKLILGLPHWSNTRLAYKALEDTYGKITTVAEMKIRFFPMDEGRPSQKILDYVKRLSDQMVIELEFMDGIPYSRVSVIEAKK